MSQELTLVYSGPRAEGLFIHEMLEEAGIGSIAKDILESSLKGAWADGSPENNYQIQVETANAEKAKNLIGEYFRSRDSK